MSYETNTLVLLKGVNFSLSDSQAGSTPFHHMPPQAIIQGWHRAGNNLTWKWGREGFRAPNAASAPTASRDWEIISAAESPQVSVFPAGLTSEAVRGPKAIRINQTAFRQLD